MAYPTGNTFPPRFQPQTPRFSHYGMPAFSALPALGGFSRPAFPPAGGGFGQQPNAFAPPQDAFAQAAAIAPPATEGFSDKNITLSDSGYWSNFFSLKGLAIGAGLIGTGILGHRVATGKFFWESTENAAKAGLDAVKTDLQNGVNKAHTALDEPTLGQFIDDLKGDKPSEEAIKKVTDAVTGAGETAASDVAATGTTTNNAVTPAEPATPAAEAKKAAKRDKANNPVHVKADPNSHPNGYFGKSDASGKLSPVTVEAKATTNKAPQPNPPMFVYASEHPGYSPGSYVSRLDAAETNSRNTARSGGFPSGYSGSFGRGEEAAEDAASQQAQFDGLVAAVEGIDYALEHNWKSDASNAIADAF